MGNIKLSPEHGVNPTIPICFWCGEEKNEIAMLGKIDREDSKAPEAVVLNYEPCDKCKELFSKGIHVVGTTTTPIVKDMFPIMKNETMELYPTGSMFIAPEEWAKEFLKANGQSQEMIDDVIERKILLMSDEIVVEIIRDIQAAEESETVEDESND